MKKSLILAATVAAFGLAVSAQAAVITNTAITGNVIAENQTGGTGATVSYIPSNYVAGDNFPGGYISLGQSFTTGTLNGTNNQMDAIYVKTANGGWAQGGSLTINIFKVDGTRDAGNGTAYNISNVVTETGSWTERTGGHALAPTWIKIELANKITLASNTQYGFALTALGVGNNANAGAFFQWDGTSTNALSSGQALSAGVKGFNANDVWLGSKGTNAGDRVFTVTAVPEPASLSLLGVGAMGLLARRRRQA